MRTSNTKGRVETRDRHTIRRLLRGDAAAFESFFEAYFPALFRFALVRLGSDEDAAEEVAQATLCRAVQKLHTYRGEAALLTWLCTFCRHEISAHLRRTHRTAEIELIEEHPEVRAALESLAAVLESAPEDSVLRRETANRVHSVLDQLPPRYGRALEWKYLNELSVREIGERLGISAKAAESLLGRARIAFRDAFLTIETGLGPAELS